MASVNFLSEIFTPSSCYNRIMALIRESMLRYTGGQAMTISLDFQLKRPICENQCVSGHSTKGQGKVGEQLDF